MYGLIDYFRDSDNPYAHQAIASFKYLKALFKENLSVANREREEYLQKKINESRRADKQSMLMYIWRYLEKNGDMSASERTTFATREKVIEIEVATGIKLLTGSAILPYCVMDKTFNFNNADLSSLKNMLKPKIEEIKVLNPDIYNESVNYKV
jgi:hypothetical protein